MSSNNTSSQTTQQQIFKVLLVGDAGVGKTTFIHRHLTGDFKKQYHFTQGANIQHLPFAIDNNGQQEIMVFECIDTAGQERFNDSRYDWYPGADAAILIFDVTSKTSYKSLEYWYNSIRRVCIDIPIVVCGNKVDCIDSRKVMPEHIQFHREHGLHYYDISVKNNYNFGNPFLDLISQLTNERS